MSTGFSDRIAISAIFAASDLRLRAIFFAFSFDETGCLLA